ncbi:MAG: symmetrical bis(5'-nucleosyl)-tetraphosphatase [Betaproteobacteria bacterium]|nr:symmetrical bis(5'-nucleosyl)-tetraphosphatase [Betaproteobacteria bacterium]
MALYAIGDLQGCLDPLRRLLDKVAFDPARDRLWFVGDLVNRGPDSLGCLRFVKSLGEGAVTVLGNHDLHLLCVAHGIEKPRHRDTLDAVLAAPDAAELLEWLRLRPLMHVEGAFALVHAGLVPEWTVPRARELAAEVEAVLQGEGWRGFLQKLYGNQPDRWREDLQGVDRLRTVVNAMTRLRVCAKDGRMDLAYKGEPGEDAGERVPWFAMPHRQSRSHTIVCGHWSALGLRVEGGVISIDSGCVWGRALTAVRLADRHLIQVRCPGSAGPEA